MPRCQMSTWALYIHAREKCRDVLFSYLNNEKNNLFVLVSGIRSVNLN